ncbi:OmpH family outer membrane protein [Fulvimonas soli]|jgi:Skp family chaperone for outer membrane proteins|uniref:Periplasmic chaperone for outer membrane proteins Skp n=1 Tax=Fulvimonas soli TaxID=155197 RepID=A0A316I7X2_9GAMM|nr:OmpH family outer membrane protein [Fulvimonas soli]PWK88511.1 periplasmic chaperone for outer membrane proteins Skp [Fulvimonas soli]TNY26842.1 hypothetical protein BV497_06295 [Fulvimonas soli]
MRLSTFTLLGAGLLSATVAAAQNAPSAPSLGGNAVPGVCLLSREAVFANAKVGKAAAARLQQLAQQIQSEMAAERKPLDADVQAYRAQAASLKPEERQSREQALGQRMQKLEADGNLRGRELEATRARVMERIGAAAQPVVASVYQQKGCGLLLDRGVVLGGNMANDLTPAVVQGLDAKMSTISFDLERLPAQAAAPAAGK